MGELTVFRSPAMRPKQEEVCPICHCPLADTAHGWVKEYRPHDDHSKCQRKYGFCLMPCPTCSGGVEAKRAAQLINDLFGDAHIPWYAKAWTYDNYPQDADQQALHVVKSFVNLVLAEKAQKRALYLVGGKGRCKTSLAVAALQAFVKKGHTGVFITTIELFDLLRAAIAANVRIARGDGDFADRYESSQGAKLLRLVKSVELLILDDLGVECGSKYEIRELYLIIEARRSHGLYTIFTSNRDAQDLELYWRSENPKEGVFADGQRIIDRLGEYCFVVPVAGRNQRERQ